MSGAIIELGTWKRNKLGFAGTVPKYVKVLLGLWLCFFEEGSRFVFKFGRAWVAELVFLLSGFLFLLF